MFPQQSDLLRLAKWLVCDTSFKRVKGWKEFGIELWESNSERCTFPYQYPVFEWDAD